MDLHVKIEEIYGGSLLDRIDVKNNKTIIRRG